MSFPKFRRKTQKGHGYRQHKTEFSIKGLILLTTKFCPTILFCPHELDQNYDIWQLCPDRTSTTERVFVKTWLPMHKLPMHNEPRLKLIRAINRRDPKFSIVWT